MSDFPVTEPGTQPPQPGGGLGWKSITGSVLAALGVGITQTPGLPFWAYAIGSILIVAGGSLAGYGFRQAIAKK